MTFEWIFFYILFIYYIGLNSELLDIVLCPSRISGPVRYHGNLMEKLVTIVNLSCQPGM